MDPDELRADIPALAETTYLNTGASGPAPRQVVAAAEECLEHHEYGAPAGGLVTFQRELGDLSRWIIYTSFPAIVVAVASLLYFDPTAIDAAWTALTIASLTIAIALTPFAILLAYILRLVKVSQVTFSQSPFLVRES